MADRVGLEVYIQKVMSLKEANHRQTCWYQKIKVEAMENRTMQSTCQTEPLTNNTQVFNWDITHRHFKCTHTRANGSRCRGDISNMQDAGISLERSAAAGEGQRELSCQSCMQQAVQCHITLTSPTSHTFLTTRNSNAKTSMQSDFTKCITKTNLLAKFIL